MTVSPGTTTPKQGFDIGYHYRRANKNEDLVVRFNRAMIRATDFVQDPKNKDEVVQLLLSETKGNKARAEVMYEQTVSPTMGLTPRSRIDMPSATPRGTSISSSCSLSTRPRRQPGHFSLTTSPRPWHWSHSTCTEKKPRRSSRAPWPRQRGQRVAFVPGLAPLPLHVRHSSLRRIVIFSPLAPRLTVTRSVFPSPS